MDSKKLENKKPPNISTYSLQLDLYSSFVSNDDSKVSNTVEFWECIPKYFFTAAKEKSLRTADGLAKPFEWPYTYRGGSYTAVIHPASVKDKTGAYKAFFPGVTEDLVEEALKKIFTIQNQGIHDVKNAESWVRFSLRMIHKELKANGRTRSIEEIKHAIEVMSKCNITLMQDNKEIWCGGILQDLITVDRKEYVADTKSQHVARLPLFVSKAINQLDYRQFNYERLMSCNEQLSRSIYKRLINHFTYASFTTDYHFMYTDLKNTGLLQQATETKNRQKVISALKELVKKNVLKNYQADSDAYKVGRKIVDVKYTVWPSQEFIKEQKAANKRNTDNKVSTERATFALSR